MPECSVLTLFLLIRWLIMAAGDSDGTSGSLIEFEDGPELGAVVSGSGGQAQDLNMAQQSEGQGDRTRNRWGVLHLALSVEALQAVLGQTRKPPWAPAAGQGCFRRPSGVWLY